MYSIRKWMFKPKKSDSSLTSQFFYADEELNLITAELDSLDGHKEPERCAALVNKLRACQDRVLSIVDKLMQQWIPQHRANTDFRVKFPDDVLTEGLAGQLWFGAECLAAGSSIVNRSVESASLRPLAKALTKHLDFTRTLLREQCLRHNSSISDELQEALIEFDKLFAEFELGYVSAMVPVKAMKEYDRLQDVMVLFCEALERALKNDVLSQDMVNDCDPSLMFAIPRLAIVCGLVIYPDGPLNPDQEPANMCEIFRPFQSLLYKIRNLLITLREGELFILEHALCTTDYNKTILQEKLSILDARYDNTSTHDKTAVDANSKQQNHKPSTKMMAMKHSSTGFNEVCENNLLFSGEKRLCYNKSFSFVSTINDFGLENKRRSTLYTEKCPVVNLRCYSRSWPETRQMNKFIQTPNGVPSSSTNLHAALTDLARARLNDDTVLFDLHGQSNCRLSFKTTIADNSRRNSEKSYVSLQQGDEYNEQIIDGVGDQPGDNFAALGTSVNYDYFSDTYMNPNLCSNFASLDQIGSDNFDLTISGAVYDNNDDVEVLCNVTREYCYTHELDDNKAEELVDNSSTVLISENLQFVSESLGDINYPYHDNKSHLTQLYDTDEQEMSSDIEDRSEEELDSFIAFQSNENEMMVAVQAAKLISCQEARANFQNTSEFIHQLFVCISGVADQLQTNYASELRHILRAVFDGYAIDRNIEVAEDALNLHLADANQPEIVSSIEHRDSAAQLRSEELQLWVPDNNVSCCLSCHAPFTLVRRRHHCRNCGQIFCHRCSTNSVRLPKFGYGKPVRVCNRCFVFYVTPFVLNE